MICFWWCLVTLLRPSKKCKLHFRKPIQTRAQTFHYFRKDSNKQRKLSSNLLYGCLFAYGLNFNDVPHWQMWRNCFNMPKSLVSGNKLVQKQSHYLDLYFEKKKNTHTIRGIDAESAVNVIWKLILYVLIPCDAAAECNLMNSVIRCYWIWWIDLKQTSPGSYRVGWIDICTLSWQSSTNCTHFRREFHC